VDEVSEIDSASQGSHIYDNACGAQQLSIIEEA